MRKMLIGLSLSLLACGGAVIATTASAQAPAPRNPVQLTQAQPLPPTRPLPRMGRGRGGPPPAQTAERREQRCENIYALAVGRLAYLEARLKLSGAQGSAFNRWRDARLIPVRRRATTCATGPQAGRGADDQAAPGPVERLTRQETRLQNRLADIRAERPALEALYSTLSPDQRQILARTARMGGRGGMMRGRMMMRRGLMRDGARGGMLQRGPMGRGAPQPDAPPPG